MRLSGGRVSMIIGLIALSFFALPIFGQGPGKEIPRFEKSECPIKVPENIAFECGNLYVRENRSKKASREIRLPVIVVKSTASDPLPDPVIYTAGGPGGSSLGRARGANNLSKITAKRDFIIFEQRGTRYADPALQCFNVDEALRRAAREDAGRKKASEYELAAVKECRDKLVKEGVDLAAYDSAASAADLEDLRKVLGIDRWNLYGISYSTRLMLNYIREYPSRVRSVVLDSVLPPESNWDETAVAGVMGSLDRMFEACERSAQCDRKYPDLKARFVSFLRKTEKEPIKVSAKTDDGTFTMTLGAEDVFDFAYILLENTRALAEVPNALDRIVKGDNEPLVGYVRDRLTQGGFVWGMRYSVWCREEMPFESLAKIRSQTAKYPFIKGFSIQGTFPEICRIWNVPAAGKIENKPVSSGVPALVLGGEFDPDTPPKWGKQVADRFPNGYFFEVYGLSHGVLFNSKCAFEEMLPAFVDDPSKAPDSSCLPKAPAIEFK